MSKTSKAIPGTYAPRGKRGVYWVQFRVQRPGDAFTTRIRENARTTDPEEAKAFLIRRYNEEMSGSGVTGGERVSFEDLASILTADYKANDRDSLRGVENSLRHLRGHFGNMRAAAIRPENLARYVAARRAEKAKPATIRKELMALRRAFSLAEEAGRIARTPRFPSIEVRNTRQRFLEDDELEKILQHLDDDVRPLIEFLRWSGWRVGEALSLQWRMIDRQERTIRIEDSKNDEPRSLPFGALSPLIAVIEAQHQRAMELAQSTGKLPLWVFARESGDPIVDPRPAWRRACKAAGLPWAWIHDLRRGAVRRMERAGVPRSVAMKITGHKTESIYKRYAVVNEADIAEGLGRIAAWTQKRTQVAVEGSKQADGSGT
jgi:integrase